MTAGPLCGETIEFAIDCPPGALCAQPPRGTLLDDTRLEVTRGTEGRLYVRVPR